MNKTVRVDRMGSLHFMAYCHECDWKYEDYQKTEQGKKEICQHVAATGHTVTVEEGVFSRYYLVEKP